MLPRWPGRDNDGLPEVNFQPRPKELKSHSRESSVSPMRRMTRSAHMEHDQFAPTASISNEAIRLHRPAGSGVQPSEGAEAIRIGGDLGAPAEANIVRFILDHVQFGAIVLGAGWKVSFANRAALYQCRHESPLQIERASLVVAAAADRRSIAGALERAHAGRWSIVPLGSDAPLLTIAVIPISACEVDTRPLALLLFGPGPSRESPTIQLYASACRLTPAETCVLRCLGEGLEPRQIADRHEVRLSTVRTQIGSIRGKTGTRSINDLTHALARLPAIMPVAGSRA
jgi:DNA-binding CsgD family transcriptional regulator